MNPNVLPKILNGDFAGAPLINAVDLTDLANMTVLLAMLDDRGGISADLCTASETIADKTRLDLLGDDFD